MEGGSDRVFKKDSLQATFGLSRASSLLPQRKRRKAQTVQAQQRREEYSSPVKKEGEEGAPSTPDGYNDELASTPLFQSPPAVTMQDQFPMRKKSGEVVLKHGITDELLALPVVTDVKVTVVSSPPPASKWMRETIRAKYDAEEKVLRTRALSILAAHRTTSPSLAEVTEESIFNCDCYRHRQAERCVVAGRIVVASDEVKLNNASSLCIESVEGDVKKMNVTPLSSFAFFPGQVILAVVENHYPDLTQEDTALDVVEVFTTTEVAVAPAVSAATKGEEGGAKERVPVVVAAGPFSSASNLDFEPLRELCKVIRQDPPSAVILCGPFIDLLHPLISPKKEEDFSLCWSFEEIFQKRVVSQLKDLVKDLPSTQFYALASPSDATSIQCYPLAAMSFGDLSDHPNFHPVPSPSTLDINGVKMGVCTVDTIGDLIQNSVTKFDDSQQPERVLKLLQAGLGQGAFYAMHPASAEAKINATDPLPLSIPCHLDAVVLPARKIRFFSKDVGGTVCVNPERLVKLSSGGTFARFNLFPSAEAKVGVEVVRI
mmetsp:Transcript_15441/g.39066  ORF Transcript_15441/g.39066 Transcript_15441/m.39066 type:complete len:544 (-) Transcript_15441:42-1673(-)